MRKKGKNAAIAIKNSIDVKRICNDLKIRAPKAYVMFMIGLTTGYRGGDLIKLTIGDIREAAKTGELTILEEKTEDTRKVPFERVVYLSDKFKTFLSDYVKDKNDAEYICWSQKGKGKGSLKKPIRRDSLGKIFLESCRRLGIANISVGVHTPRKTYGYNQYISHDKDINFVQELFGHSAPKITRNYIGIDEEMAKEASTTMDRFVS